MAMTAAALRREQRKATPSEGQAVPFVRGTRAFVEGPFLDTSRQIGTAAQAVGPVDVPARGWLRHVVLLVEGSGGVLGSGVLHEDWPFVAIRDLALIRPNGDPYFGPLGGYSAFLANLLGGYVFESDPRAAPEYDASINCRFLIRIPVEITAHDAYGALINQDAAAPYRIQFGVNDSASCFTTAPTTTPTLRIRAWVEGWEQPAPTDLLGRSVEQQPPGTPTAQFWSEQTFNIVSGLNTIRLTDVGNLIRNLVFVLRTGATPTRSDANWPQDSLRFTYDARTLLDAPFRWYRRTAWERLGFVPPTGVVWIGYTHDGEGHAGDEARSLYLPTTDASRLEIVGQFGASGTLTVITNDVSPAGVPVS